MAPPAAQRASFEKNSCAYARTVMDGVFFDIENKSFGHWRQPYFT